MKQYILTHGNLLTMRDRTIKYDTDILIRDGKIQKIGRNLTAFAAQEAAGLVNGLNGEVDAWRCEADILNGETKFLDISGRYVIPGLIDSHCHYDADYMGKMFLACGVTSVRNMRGYKRHAEYAAETLAGKRTGPYIYSSGPIYDGEDPSIPDNSNEIIRTEADVEQAIEYTIRNGFLWLKTYPSIEPELYRYLLKRARQQGLPVCGHMSKKLDDKVLADAGYYCCEHSSSLPSHKADIRYLAEAGMWFTPTQAVCETLPDYVWNGTMLPELKHFKDLPECERESWESRNRKIIESYRSQGVRPDIRVVISRGRTFLEYSDRFMAGTDCAYPGIIPGFSMADELEKLVELYGCTAFEALKAATVNPAAHIGLEEKKGSIREGMDADIVVLAGNPLADIGNVRKVSMVFQGTNLYDEETIRAYGSEAGFLKKEEIEFIHW